MAKECSLGTHAPGWNSGSAFESEQIIYCLMSQLLYLQNVATLECCEE